MGNSDEARNRISQIRNEFSSLEAETDREIAQCREKKKTVSLQEEEDRQQIRSAGDAAYAELEAAVKSLVELPSNRDDVSERDPSLVTLLNTAIDRFKDLSTTSQVNTFQLGTATGDCDSIRTGLKRHIDKIEGQCWNWNAESKSAWESSDHYRQIKDGYASNQNNLNRQADDAAADHDSIGGFFSSIVSSNAADKARDTRNRANDNERDRSREEDNEKGNYHLSMIARNGGAGCQVLLDRTRAMYDEFGTEQLRILEAQKVECSLWRGFMDLSDMIADPEFRSSRDNSLRVVLKILNADDNKFGTVDRYAAVEQRIRTLITDKWGKDALAKLLIPGGPRGVEGFLAVF